jgi:hypothetical protein
MSTRKYPTKSPGCVAFIVVGLIYYFAYNLVWQGFGVPTPLPFLTYLKLVTLALVWFGTLIYGTVWWLERSLKVMTEETLAMLIGWIATGMLIVQLGWKL